MKTRQRFVYAATAIILAVLMVGCGTELVVSGPDNQDLGVPFKVPETYVADAIYMKSKSGEECAPLPFRKFVSLPTGATYHVKPDSEPFSKSDFTIDLNPNGTLEKIMFNADPELSETIDSTAGLITAIADLATPSDAAVPLFEEEPPNPQSSDVPATETLNKKVQETLKEAAVPPEKRIALQEELQVAFQAELQAALQEILEAIKPSCDTGEHITCIQRFVVGQIKKCDPS